MSLYDETLVSKALTEGEIVSALDWFKLGFEEARVIGLHRELLVTRESLWVFGILNAENLESKGGFPVSVSYNTRELHFEIKVGDSVLFSETYPKMEDVKRKGYLGDGFNNGVIDLVYEVQDILLATFQGKPVPGVVNYDVTVYDNDDIEEDLV